MAPRNTAEWDTVDKGAQVGGGNYKLKCKSCGIEFSGSGFRLSAHIAGGQWARRAGVRGCTQPDASLRSKAQETARERDAKKAEAERLRRMSQATRDMQHVQDLTGDGDEGTFEAEGAGGVTPM